MRDKGRWLAGAFLSGWVVESKEAFYVKQKTLKLKELLQVLFGVQVL